MTWLITGGAGFIGAHVVHALEAAGSDVVVLDDLSTGVGDRLAGSSAKLVSGSLHSTDTLRDVFSTYDVDGVVHLAAKKQPGESVEKPLLYYRENVGGLGTLVETMLDAGIHRLVYSSSASTYGTQEADVMTEDLPCRPDSPYGETKLVGEWMLADVARVSPLRFVALRYFNAAGAASPELADVGAYNLIPIVFERLTAGRPPQIYGTDYPTPDGTTIRDYIHVSDLATAHVAAARHLTADGESAVVNVGSGVGTSTRQVVDTILSVSGYGADPAFAPEEVDRRAGDPPVSTASAEKIQRLFGWKAEHDLHDMVESAWAGWTRLHPEAVYDGRD